MSNFWLHLKFEKLLVFWADMMVSIGQLFINKFFACWSNKMFWLLISTTVPEWFFSHPSRNHTFELERILVKDGHRGVQTNSFYFKAIQQWNKLPRSIVDSPSFAVFNGNDSHYIVSGNTITIFIWFVNKIDSPQAIYGLWICISFIINKNESGESQIWEE